MSVCTKISFAKERPARKASEPQMLEKIVHCYICDERYYVMRQGGRYYLRMKDRNGECVCSKKSISTKFVEGDVDIFFKDFALEADWKESVADALREEPDFQEVEEDRRRLLRQRDILDARVEAHDDYPVSEYLEGLKAIQDGLASLESPIKDQVIGAGEYLGDFSKVWSAGSASVKNAMLHRTLHRIYFDPEVRRIHSIVPRGTFLLSFRGMAERQDVTLEPLSDTNVEKCRKSQGLPGKTSQFTTSALKIEFSHHVALENLAERIETKRVKSLMTRAALAERLEVSTYSIASWENGATPRLEFHERIAAWLADPLPEWTKLLEEENIGQRIRDQQQAWGLSQVELGDSIGVPLLR